MSQELISWRVDVFFSVDFLLPAVNLFWAWDLKVKQDFVWKGTKRLGCSDELVNSNGRG